jgi:hypothetical protein
MITSHAPGENVKVNFPKMATSILKSQLPNNDEFEENIE